MSADSMTPTDESASQNPDILSSHNIPEQVDEVRERIDTLVDQKMWGQLHSLLASLPAADVASLIAHYQEPVLSSIFQGLPDDLKPDVLAELPSDAATELATALPPPATADIANEMAPDDAADVLGELDKEISSKIIEGMDEDSAEEVRKLMTYPETSAGGIMTTDLLRFSKDQTVLEALDAIADNPDEEHIYQVYITDEEGVLIGTVSIWELLHQRDRLVKLGAIMEQQVMAVRSDTDQEEVAELMAKYNLSVIAVVDDNGVLLGRITHDDAADILKEEAEEDILRLAGTGSEDLGNVSAWRSCLYRLPWLFLTLLGGVVTASLLNSYTNHFKFFVLLAAFVPNVMAMGGNTGLQSSVLMIREIASGDNRRHSIARLLLHECSTGALMGLLCGIGIFICALSVASFTGSGREALRISVENSGLTMASAPFLIATIVAAALFSAMSFSAALGAVIPLFLTRIGIDPAVSSGPLISFIIDICAMLIYYGVTILFLLHFLPS